MAQVYSVADARFALEATRAAVLSLHAAVGLAGRWRWHCCYGSSAVELLNRGDWPGSGSIGGAHGDGPCFVAGWSAVDVRPFRSRLIHQPRAREAISKHLFRFLYFFVCEKPLFVHGLAGML